MSYHNLRLGSCVVSVSIKIMYHIFSAIRQGFLSVNFSKYVNELCVFQL